LFSLFLLAACLKPSGLQAQPADAALTASVERASEAGVPESALNQVLKVGAEYGLSSQDSETFLLILQAVQEENLPVGPFVGKIEEGLAKGISPLTIVSVVQRKIDDYRFVRQTLAQTMRNDQPEGNMSHQNLTRMVGSLDAGLSREEFTGFMERAPSTQLSMLARAAEGYALLKQIQFDEALAAEILFIGLRNKSFTPSWRYLAKVVATARRRGMTDQEIATAARTALREQRPFKEFMEKLGFTSRDVRRGPVEGSAK
jgi:hypothetical protein